LALFPINTHASWELPLVEKLNTTLIMQKITTFLTYNDQAEAAARLYTSLFNNSEITHTTRYGKGAYLPEGTVMSIRFRLDGQEFFALNAGPHFKFSEGISLFVNCEGQAEVDYFWDKLSEGGEPGQCGWLKDKFGVSWQVIPAEMSHLMSAPDAAKASRVMQSMMKMTKIDISALEALE
jgi:predicted 3-demethylubiquinone-9 3-methyltransferase (glyoxalase superfamily)